MKKILLMAISLGAMVASAESYLYWMVGKTSALSYDKAMVRVLQNGTATDNYLSLYYADGTAVETTPNDYVTKTYAQSAYEANLGMYAAFGGLFGETYSYIIELRNDNGLVAQSGELGYASISDYLVDSGMGVPGGGAWEGTSYAIPEPTSGMMMLLGVAALALRRRRRV